MNNTNEIKWRVYTCAWSIWNLTRNYIRTCSHVIKENTYVYNPVCLKSQCLYINACFWKQRENMWDTNLNATVHPPEVNRVGFSDRESLFNTLFFKGRKGTLYGSTAGHLTSTYLSLQDASRIFFFLSNPLLDYKLG